MPNTSLNLTRCVGASRLAARRLARRYTDPDGEALRDSVKAQREPRNSE